MNEHDPPPLTDPASGAPEPLRDALAAARAAAPTPAQLARLAARLPIGAPPPAGPSGAAPVDGRAAGGAPPSILSGALIGAALGAIVSGVGLWWEPKRDAPPTRAPLAAVTTPAEAPRGILEAPRAPPVVAPPPAPAAASASASAPTSAVSAGASAPAITEPSAAASGGASDRAGALPGEPPDAIERETEAHLLQRAEDALSASPAQALALTDAHASRFPAGSLGQERELVAIQALVRLGRAGDARARAARFVAAFPGSVHRRRIEAMVGP